MAAERTASEARSLAERLQNLESQAMKTFKKRFREELVSARLEIQETLEQVRKNRTAEKAQQALKRLSSLSQNVVQGRKSSDQEIPVEILDIGDGVEISSLETSGILLDSPIGKKRVRIRVGDSQLSVPTNLLRGKEKLKSPQKREQQNAQVKNKSIACKNSSSPTPEPNVYAAMTIDVRGRRAEDALEQIVAMLDQAALKQFKGVRIIHGHGTGRLKEVTRDYISQSPYVMTYRSGTESEGGDGVTMVEMR